MTFPRASKIFSITEDGAQVGTMTFAAGGTVPTFAAAADVAVAEVGAIPVVLRPDHDGQGCRLRGIDHGNEGLELHGLGELLLEHGHVHNPSQALGRGAFKVGKAAIVAPHAHVLHGCGVKGIWPAAKL